MQNICIAATDDNSYSALHIILLGDSCSTQDIKWFLKTGISVNSVSKNYVTPLHIAVKNKKCSLNVIKYLLHNGANVHAKDISDETPLHYVVQYNSKKAKDIANLLLDRGAVIDDVNIVGCSALYYAVEMASNKDVVELLLDRGANVNLLNMDRDSPLHRAVNVYDYSCDVVQQLIDRGANIHESNKDKWQPMHFAAQWGNREIIDLLICSGARVNVLDDCNQSPLALSAYYSSDRKVTKMLLDSGALMSYGNSPLKKAVGKYNMYEDEDSLENVQMLLKYDLLENAVLATGLDSYPYIPPTFNDYLEKCRQEIQLMQSLYVDHNTTLAQFVFYLRPQMQRKMEDDTNRSSDKLLHLISIKAFPLYSEVTSGLLKRKYLIDKLEKQKVFSLSKGTEVMVVLHCHVLHWLTRYLSDDDILNLVLAFYTPPNSFNFSKMSDFKIVDDADVIC